MLYNFERGSGEKKNKGIFSTIIFEDLYLNRKEITSESQHSAPLCNINLNISECFLGIPNTC